MIVGNQLYNENDYVSESDLTGFQDLLNRALAAVKKAEQLAVSLPCPYRALHRPWEHHLYL